MKVVLRLLCIWLLMVLSVVAAQAEKRIALVIGNSAYKSSPLTNPRNDAQLMADTLKDVGFEVRTLIDGDHRAMKLAMVRFGRALRSSDTVGLFYYAGHGVQARGENFLIPVDADITDESEIDVFAINVNDYLRTMERSSSRINIVVLDACRNNPFVSSFRSQTRGLARVDAPRGTYIAYATAPGQVALDGDGQNSPYTKALTEAMAVPGLTLEQTFKQARRTVLAATGEKQIPWETSSITGSFYFKEAPTKREFNKEDLTWSLVRNSTNPELVNTYLKQYPNGRYALEAKALIAALNRKLEERKAQQERQREKAELERLAVVALAEKAKKEALEAAQKAEARRQAALEAANAAEAERKKRLEAVRVAEEKARKEAKKRQETELADWRAVAESSRPEELKAFLEKYPSGTFSDLANARLAALSKLRLAALPAAENVTVNTEPESTPSLGKRELVLQIQQHLQRLGCRPGRPDGDWGGKSRAALKRFARHANVQVASLSPSPEVLDAVAAPTAKVCPLVCSSGEVLRNGRCVAKAKPSVKKKSKQARLPKRTTRPASKRKNKPAKKRVTRGAVAKKQKSGASKSSFPKSRTCKIRGCQWWRNN